MISRQSAASMPETSNTKRAPSYMVTFAPVAYVWDPVKMPPSLTARMPPVRTRASASMPPEETHTKPLSWIVAPLPDP